MLEGFVIVVFKMEKKVLVVVGVIFLFFSNCNVNFEVFGNFLGLLMCEVILVMVFKICLLVVFVVVGLNLICLFVSK